MSLQNNNFVLYRCMRMYTCRNNTCPMCLTQIKNIPKNIWHTTSLWGPIARQVLWKGVFLLPKQILICHCMTRGCFANAAYQAYQYQSKESCSKWISSNVLQWLVVRWPWKAMLVAQLNSIRMFAAWFPPQETASNSSSGNVATFFLQELFWLDLENNCSLRPSARPPVPKAGLQPKHTEQKSLDNMFFFEWISKWTMLDASNTTLISHKHSSKNPTFWIPKCCDFANAHKLFEHADQINRFLFWILWFTNYDILGILQSAPILAHCVVKRFWRTYGKQIEVSSPKILPHIERFLPHIEHFDQSNRNNIDRWANWCKTVWRKTDLHPL